MRARNWIGLLICLGLLLSACGSSQPTATPTPVEVTRQVTRIVRQTQVVTSVATRIVQQTQIVTAVVTRIVQQIVIATPPAFTLNIQPATAMGVRRANHTATRLADGRILLVGGSQATDDFLAAVEILDPATGILSPAAPLHTPRHGHSATPLHRVATLS